MANYTFTKVSIKLSSDAIWDKVNQSLIKGSVINSISGIPYTIADISTISISYTGDERSNGDIELISKKSFIKVIEGLKELGTFNSNQSKLVFQEAKIYRQRSPMFAILMGTGLIKKINNHTMSKRGQLLELAENYDEVNTVENLEAMKKFLKKETLYFTEYYSDPEGKENVKLSAYRGSGKFIDFAMSSQFLQPSLLTVRSDDNEIIYLPLSKIVLE